MYWFRDDTNRTGLLLEISDRVSVAALKAIKLKINHISTDIVDFKLEGFRALLIRLEAPQDQDVFLKLCLDLVDIVTRATEKTEDTFTLILQRLKQWQSLLNGKSGNLLSRTEIQGLFSELSFVVETLAKDPSKESLVIRGWEGPEKNQHDFLLNDTVVEVKSIAGNSRGKVRITSEDQLDTHLARLFLHVFFLTVMEDCDGGESLNSIVWRIKNMLVSAENRDWFEEKLVDAGYIDIPNYNTPCFQMNEYRTYLVTDEFPKITRVIIPEGIDTVTYCVSLATIEKFKVPSTDIFGVRP